MIGLTYRHDSIFACLLLLPEDKIAYLQANANPVVLLGPYNTLNDSSMAMHGVGEE